MAKSSSEFGRPVAHTGSSGAVLAQFRSQSLELRSAANPAWVSFAK
jgi:hypothetical protein